MADVSIRIDINLYGPRGVGFELGRLMSGPGGHTVMRMESVLMGAFATTELRVHVITGQLLASGHPSSSFDGDVWSGSMAFARHPGIFELWRGDRPTRDHPEGRHYFFDPGGPAFERGVREAVWDWVTGGDGGPAPSEGLGPWSGGGG